MARGEAETALELLAAAGTIKAMHLTSQTAAALLSFQCCSGDVKRWTNVLNTLAQTAEEEPLKVRQFMQTLAAVIPEVEQAHIAEVITMDLNLGQKCFVAAVLSAFMDHWIVQSGSDLGDWMQYWDAGSELFTTAGKLVREDPTHIDAKRMDEVWNALRLAVS